MRTKPILDTRKGECYLCGAEGYTHLHHIFDGPNRRLSTRYGLMVYLCVRCHNVPPYGVHHNIRMMRRLQVEGQRAFEQRWGTREYFRSVFGRNYIMEDDYEKET